MSIGFNTAFALGLYRLFARYFVVEVFDKSFAGDRARLAGRQINLIRDTCEFLYRLEDDRENRNRNAQSNEDVNEENIGE